MKHRVLFILHLPPPVHGSSVVGKQIMGMDAIHELYDARFVNLNTSTSTDAIGRVNAGKLLAYLRILRKVICNLILYRPKFLYISIAIKGSGFFKDLGVVALAKLFRVPIVFHLHNKGAATVQCVRPYRWLYPWVFHNSKVIVLSKYLYSDVASFVPKEAAEICPNGIPDEALAFSRRPNQQVPTILFLSNLIESKGVYILLQACALLKSNNISFRVEFIGGVADIDEDAFAERCGKLDLGDMACYLGKQYGRDKFEAFQRADIFALPTYNECMPLVLLEAMQWRLPIVSTPEGGIPELVVDGETGFLVPRRDAEALAEKLQVLIMDPQLRTRFGNAGRKRYEEHYTQEHFESRMKAVLKSVISR